jgi:hypothetical protein
MGFARLWEMANWFIFPWQWNVGDKCLAVYSEDGLIYDAEIIEICSGIANMCVVRYSDYGNEEQQYLTDLMPATQEETTSAYSHQVELEYLFWSWEFLLVL